MKHAIWVVLVLSGLKAWALPQYTLKEGQQCSYCHATALAGPLNAMGRYYGEHFTFDGFKKESSKKKLKGKQSAKVQ